MGKFLTEEKANQLMNDLLDAFSIAFGSDIPILNSVCIWNPPKGTEYLEHSITTKFSIENFRLRKESINTAGNISINFTKNVVCRYEDFIETNIYNVSIGNRKFKMLFYDAPDDIGYSSILPNYDSETYICADISELREDNSEMSEIIFGFDIEKMHFLELFELFYVNKINFSRVPQSIDELEKKFFGRKL